MSGGDNEREACALCRDEMIATKAGSICGDCLLDNARRRGAAGHSENPGLCSAHREHDDKCGMCNPAVRARELWDINNELRAENEGLHTALREARRKKKWHDRVLQIMHDRNAGGCVGAVHEVMGGAFCGKKACEWRRHSSDAITNDELVRHVIDKPDTEPRAENERLKSRIATVVEDAGVARRIVQAENEELKKFGTRCGENIDKLRAVLREALDLLGNNTKTHSCVCDCFLCRNGVGIDGVLTKAAALGVTLESENQYVADE